MIYGGLVSITFRQLTVDELIKLLKQTELSAIEWGGDVHVPHGDIECALDTRHRSEDAGISIAAYGSYYRVGHYEPVPFERILETALALGAPIIRVWAGKRNSEDADKSYWQRVVDDSKKIAHLTAQAGLQLAYEYHPNTLTNTLPSTLKLLEKVDHNAVTTYWQAPTEASVDDNLSALTSLQPWLSNIHVNTGRQPLSSPQTATIIPSWKKYLRKIASFDRNHYALIEFVKNDSPDQFIEDAVTLKSWL